MASNQPPPEHLIKIQSRRDGAGGGGNLIHPVMIDSAPPNGQFREIKHFKKWVSWLIPSFVIVNVAVFTVSMYINNCPKNSVSCVGGFLGRFSFQPLKENPLLGPSSSTLQKMGALDVSKVVHDHQGWRLITCMWLHGGVFHILANMLSLLVIGIRLEQEFGFGKVRFLELSGMAGAFVRIGVLYVISGFGGSLLSALFIQSNISVGASGALFGLLGAMLSELITNWTIYANKIAALLTLVIIIVINLAVGILPHVDNFAHLGGFATGFLLGFVFLIRPQYGWVSQRYAPPGYATARPKPKFKTYQCVLWVVSLILVIAGLVTGLVLLLRGVDLNDHCSWCHYMSCVPTSRWSCNTKPMSCMSEQNGDQLTLTCSGNGKNSTYTWQHQTSSQIQGLCSELCR